MPHLTVEYSGNLDGHLDMAAFCRALRQAILDTGLFELGAVRVRALRAEHFAIADLLPENAFVDMSFRVGTGRSEADRKAAGDRIFRVAEDFCAGLLASPHFALSLEIREINSSFSWKRNAMHPRLRDQA
ncbi:5-carboxymethyl-2-hydroxymuconate Delta-isomerase [Polymorphum gilvum]|uniref:5-carboxymethyl-2-hydroxymuconate isomerase n=1 Tax=Polymorphum gilvum (strain LMG 25793 / CGMCC 1.9160 / SL003B-26A1) TaxID=991905 RepID=F2IX88_POLGS|nr:5-carboxymethyl-2-hydroxymuconate Delta-isomerase [Polymorphum gilvum]ADZ70406.1 5-carboxymethyl-2-hydroxymuconate isomerase [Polymorphum gilvum SL003B-26A1]